LPCAKSGIAGNNKRQERIHFGVGFFFEKFIFSNIMIPLSVGTIKVVEMMRSKELTGRVVVNRLTGAKLGKVCQVDYCPGERWLRGLVVETSGWRRSKRYVKRQNIAVLGEHVVLVDGPLEALPPGAFSPDVIYTPDGRLWGRIKSLHIDPSTAQVDKAEVQISLMEDLTQGCRMVEAASSLALCEDRVLYHPPENDMNMGSDERM
jgi:uncharacterized protein YrrD